MTPLAFADANNANTAVQKAVMNGINLAEVNAEVVNDRMKSCKTDKVEQFFLSSCKKSKRKEYRGAQRQRIAAYSIAAKHFAPSSGQRQQIDLNLRHANLLEEAVELDLNKCLRPKRDKADCLARRKGQSVKDYLMNYRTQRAELEASFTSQPQVTEKVSLRIIALKAENRTIKASDEANFCENKTAESLPYTDCPQAIQAEILSANQAKIKAYTELIGVGTQKTNSLRQYELIIEKMKLENKTIILGQQGCFNLSENTQECITGRNGIDVKSYALNYRIKQRELSDKVIDLY